MDQALLNGLELLKQTTGEGGARGWGRCRGLHSAMSSQGWDGKDKTLSDFEAALRLRPVEWLGDQSRGLRMGSLLSPWWTPCVLLVAGSAGSGPWPGKPAL